jgi:hypothetical protein
VLGQPSAHGIGEHIRHHSRYVCFQPNNTIVVSHLPDGLTDRTFPVVPGALLCTLCEGRPRRRVCHSLYDEVQMIGHETVRNNFKPASLRREQNLRTHDVDDCARGKDRVFLVRADGEEISISTRYRRNSTCVEGESARWIGRNGCARAARSGGPGRAHQSPTHIKSASKAPR